MENCIFANIHRKARTLPELFVEENEDIDIAKLPPEEILLRWVNYRLKAAGSSRVLTNFTTDIQDGECYHVLFNNLLPNKHDISGFIAGDPEKSADNFIKSANKIGFGKFLTVEDVLEVIQRFFGVSFEGFIGQTYDEYCIRC